MDYIEIPHNLDAERAMLACAAQDRFALLTAMEYLVEGDLYGGKHNPIYEAMISLENSGKRADTIMVTDWLLAANQLEAVGGPDGVKEILGIGVDPGRIEEYVEVVERDSIRRKIFVAGREIMAVGVNVADADQAIADANHILSQIHRRGRGGLQTAATYASDYFDVLDEWQQTPLLPSQVRGTSTYIPSLDLILAGMNTGDLHIVCGRPGSGKSALVFEVALRMAERGRRVLIFSLEMVAQAIIGRWAASRSGIQTQRVKRGVVPAGESLDLYVTAEEFSRYVSETTALMGQTNVLIDESRGLTMSQVRARAIKKARETGGIDLIIADHGRLIRSPKSSRGENTAKTEGRKSQQFRELAFELGCAGIMVWQLNRQVEMRTDRRPRLSDLRDTGEIEENADGVIGLYRDAYYNPDTVRPNVLELLALKLREGEMGVRRSVYYDASISRFGELEDHMVGLP